MQRSIEPGDPYKVEKELADKDKDDLQFPAEIGRASITGTIESADATGEGTKDPGSDAEDEDDTKMDYATLKDYVNKVHPRNKGKKFSVCANLGGHNCCCNCCGSDNITELSKEIGLGASLFLMSSKALAYFFLLITIINIPVYYIMYSSSEAEAHTIQDYFSKLTLGNLGQSEMACSTANYVNEKKLHLACSNGFAKLGDLQYLGISGSDDAMCINMLEPAADISEFLEPGCWYDDEIHEDGEKHLLKADKIATFEQFYENNCRGKSSCNIDLHYEEGDSKYRDECVAIL